MRVLKVLIVDDSAEDTRLASSWLQKAGHNVLTAVNGTQGMEMALRELPDLILMDLVMPEINGFQVTRQLSNNDATRDIPIIVVSGKSQDIDRAWALRQGARAYLTKKLEKRVLLQTINEVMA